MVHGDPAHATLRVGRYCSIADEVTIFLGAEHRVDWVTTYPFTVLDPAFRDVPGHPATKGDVVIGNDVWIGFGALILSGVTIGDGAVIGARSVVTRDVPPYAIAGGNPSRVLRARFSEQEVQDLLRIRWWDWDRARVNASMPLLLSGNVGEFIRRVDAGLA
jgi:acetyltransferase-like isoleucine patch superfamily enzyme